MSHKHLKVTPEMTPETHRCKQSDLSECACVIVDVCFYAVDFETCGVSQTFLPNNGCPIVNF